MAKTPEKKVKDKIVAKLKAAGAYYFYPVTGGFSSSGVPDIIVCYRGKFIGIEVKADLTKKGPTALQQDNLTRISENGGIALVLDVDNWEVNIRKLLQEASWM